MTTSRVPLLAAALSVLAGLLAAATPLIDDAYIYLSYMRTFVESPGHWGMLPEITADTATAPLQVLWLALCYVVTGKSLTLTLAVATAVPWFLTAWILLRTYRKHTWTVVALLMALLLLPPLVSSIGMESAWMITALAALWAAMLKAFRTDSRADHLLVGLAAAALAALRPDAALLLAPLLLLGTTLSIRYLTVAIPVAVAATVTYLTTRFFLLGSLVPDSVFMKIQQSGDWGGKTILNGWTMYWDSSPIVVVTFVIAAVLVGSVLGSLLLNRANWRTPAAVMTAASVVSLVAIAAAAVPPYHWYYILPSVALILAAFDAAVRAAPHRTAAALLLLTVAFGTAWGFSINSGHAPVTTNWASESQMLTIGREVVEITEGQDIDLEGEIGTIAYSCRCNLLDEFSQPVATRDNALKEATTLKGRLLKANYTFRTWSALRPPAPWLLTVHEPTSYVKAFPVIDAAGTERTYYLAKRLG